MSIVLTKGVGPRRVFVTVMGLMVMCVLALMCVTANTVKAQSKQAFTIQNRSAFYDPDQPTAQYVLGKLNDHLIVNAENMDHIENLNVRISKIEEQHIGERLATIDTTQGHIMWLVMTGVAGIVTLLLKELLGSLKLVRKSNEQSD